MSKREKHLLYLVGPPGSGKSTLAAYLTEGLNVAERCHRGQYRLTKDVKAGVDTLRERPVYWLEYFAAMSGAPVAYEWGRPAGVATKREADASWSRGTDRYDKCIHQWFFHWLRESAPEMPLVLAEGARLGYADGIREMIAAGYRVQLAYLDTPEELCEERRAARGSKQAASWVKGRRTAAERVAEEFDAIRLDGRLQPWQLAWHIRNHPVAAALMTAPRPVGTRVVRQSLAEDPC